MTRLRLAVAQIQPQKGDYRENLRRIGGVFAQVAGWDRPPDILVFPECMTSGYFVEGGVQDVAVTGGTLFRDLAELHERSGLEGLEVEVGFYEEFENRYHNSAMYAVLDGSDSRILHVHRKVFLPTYGVFDEERFVESGLSVNTFETGWGKAAVLICEDAWHSIVPTIAALKGAQLIIVPSASPARGLEPSDSSRECAQVGLPNSVERWTRLMRSIAEEHGVFVVLAQLVGFEGGKGFPGGSLVIGPAGDMRVMGPVFEEAIVDASIDLRDITRARAAVPLLADLEATLPHLERELSRRNEKAGRAARDERPTISPARRPVREPETAEDPGYPVVRELGRNDPLRIDPEMLEKWLVGFLRDEVTVRRNFKKGIVGLSGGVDSSVTAYLAVRALGRENVTGVSMPYRTSSSESREHAELVARELGIDFRVVDISKAVDGYYEALGEDGDPQRRGNVMARTRMIVLFDLSAALQALPLGTGNKTERLLGYFTWHADDSPPVNPLGDIFKTQVWQLADHLGVPGVIVEKPATADLIQGQTDEADLGIPYSKADLILHWLLLGLKTDEITAFGFTEQEVTIVQRRLESTHWKRRLPTVAMVSQTAIGEYYLRPVDY